MEAKGELPPMEPMNGDSPQVKTNGNKRKTQPNGDFKEVKPSKRSKSVEDDGFGMGEDGAEDT